MTMKPSLFVGLAALITHASCFEVNVVDFGAIGDGVTICTSAIRSALLALGVRGGGRLAFPPGKYVSGPFNLTSNIQLLLDNALLVADAPSAFKLIPALPSYGMGRDKLPNDFAGRFEPFIGCYNSSNVSITTNSSGNIDGSGIPWWVAKSAGTLQNTPPHLFESAWSSDIEIGAPAGSPLNALTFMSSPFWNIHIYDSDNAWVHDISVFADVNEGNTDGCDPDSSRNVLIERMQYVGGDDGVAIKSGWDNAGIVYNTPVVNVTVRDSTFSTRAACVTIGSEMSGGAENITVYNVTCVHTGNGFYVKSAPGRGGYVRNFTVTDSIIDGVDTAIQISLTYGDHPLPPLTWNASALPELSGFTFARIRGTSVTKAGLLSGAVGVGQAGAMVNNIRLLDVALGPSEGWKCVNVTGSASGVVPPIDPATCPQLA
jgi:polygalacturonase